MRNIREIQAELDTLRDQYEARVAQLEDEIVAVRQKRHTKIKPVSMEGWIDYGRDATQWNPYERG